MLRQTAMTRRLEQTPGEGARGARGAAGLIAAGVTCLVASLLLVGCTTPRPEPAPVVLQPAPPPPPPEPTLVSASDAHLTLFGEFPDRTRVPFHARAASPMEQHTFTTEGADFDVAVSPDGKWIVFSSTRHTTRPDLYLKTIDGRAVTQLTSDPAADVQPCFSPDGKTIAFASDRSGNWDLWLVNLDGGQTRQVTNSPLHEVHPSFAPEGKRLVYCVFNERADQWELWTLQLDQSGSRRMIGVGLFPQWSPAADSIVYQRARERGGRWFSIWRVDLVLGEPKFPVELSASAEMAHIQPAWSSNGEWVTYGTARLGDEGTDWTGPGPAVLSRGDIWVMRGDGTSPVQLTDGAGAHFGPVWSSDQRVYFTSLQNGVENIWSVLPMLAPAAGTPTAGRDTSGKETIGNVPAAVPASGTVNQGG